MCVYQVLNARSFLTITPWLDWCDGKSFPKISEAKDGRREAHMDVLVAVFGKDFPSRHGLLQAGWARCLEHSVTHEKAR